MNVEQREVINGKPHFGLFFGLSVILQDEVLMKDALDLLKKDRAEKFKGFQIRSDEMIYRTPFHIFNGSIALKFIAWGRAYKVMKLLSKGNKRSKKVYVSGRRKRVLR